MNRFFTNILATDTASTTRFYETVFGMRRHFTASWFVILVHDDAPGLELGILSRDHAVVPSELRSAPAGVVLTFVVEDCDAVLEAARRAGAHVVREPEAMPYGQRRALIRDPEGTVVDISAPIPDFRFDPAAMA